MDNIDTDKGLNDFLPIQDWFNEMHAKNTSQKVRAVFKNKGNSGIPLAVNPPFGYIKDPNNKNKWIIDEPAAKLVKEIFSLYVQGVTSSQIAKRFTEARNNESDRILSKFRYENIKSAIRSRTLLVFACNK